MGYRNRELEVKLVIEGASLAKVDKRIASVSKHAKRSIHGKSEDVYFSAPKGAKADFVRLRVANHDDGAKFTIKFTDKKKKGVVDRVEKDLNIDDFNQAHSMCTDLFGAPAGRISKKYHVYFMGKKQDESATAISIYQLTDDSRVFLEVESKSLSIVNYWLGRVVKLLPYSMKRSKKSLYQIFIEPKLKK